MNKKESAPKESAKIDEDVVTEKEKVTKPSKSKKGKMYSVRFFTSGVSHVAYVLPFVLKV